MKISNDDLKKMFKSHIIESTLLSRKNCPPINDIINLFRSELSETKKSKIIDHLSSCYYCLQEFEFILKTLRIGKNLSTDIRSLLRKEKIFYRRKKLIPFFPWISWKYASLLSGIALLAFLFIIIFTIQNKEKKEFRGNFLTSIKLIEPLKGKYSKSLLKFRWIEIKGSDYYIIELFDEALRPIWKSNKIYTNSVVLPKIVSKKLTENKKYFWILSAYFPDGEKIESRIECFTLTN